MYMTGFPLTLPQVFGVSITTKVWLSYYCAKVVIPLFLGHDDEEAGRRRRHGMDTTDVNDNGEH